MNRVLQMLLITLVTSGLLAVRHIWRTNETNADSTSAEQAPPTTRFYAILFTYQDEANRISTVHTFATFVKLTCRDHLADSPPPGTTVECRTISWLPARFSESLRLTPFRVRGKNFGLRETLEFSRRLGTTTRHWGPYEIDEAFYQRALDQIALLNSGHISYKLYNSTANPILRTSNDDVLHCIDAVLDLAGRANTGPMRGYELAEFAVREHLAPHLKPDPVPVWLYDAVLRAPEGAAAAP